MEYKEFMLLASTIKETYPSANLMGNANAIEIWYNMLKDLEYRIMGETLVEYIKNNKFAPTIADLRETYQKKTIADWSAEWHKLLNGARVYELNEPAQYALKTLTRDYVDYCMKDNPAKTGQCMKDFERLYYGYHTYGIRQQLGQAGLLEKVITPLPQRKTESIEAIPEGAIKLPDGSYDYSNVPRNWGSTNEV